MISLAFGEPSLYSNIANSNCRTAAFWIVFNPPFIISSSAPWTSILIKSTLWFNESKVLVGKVILVGFSYNSVCSLYIEAPVHCESEGLI